MTALVIDDDKSSLAILYYQLKLMTIDTVEVATISGAIQALEKGDRVYSIIFLDLGLTGGMTGLDFLELRKTNHLYYNIPVIVTSGHASMNIISECMQKGADAYLIKPLQISLLAKTLGELGAVK